MMVMEVVPQRQEDFWQQPWQWVAMVLSFAYGVYEPSLNEVLRQQGLLELGLVDVALHVSFWLVEV